MGALCGTPLNSEEEKNKRISKEQDITARKNNLEIKLLLLGTGDSGKMTMRKQLKNVYGEGFSESSRRQLAPVVIANLFDGFRDVLKAMQTFSINLDNQESKAAAELIRNAVAEAHLTPAQHEACIRLFDDDGFASCVARKSEYTLQDCWTVFTAEMRNYPAWGGENWVPSVNDCVIARVRTSGIIEETFTVDSVTFRLFDVGGQRAERRKWIHCFDNTNTVIFVVALSEYDLNLYEDGGKNRLLESIELFDEICNSKWFVNSSILLFLNKVDLFEKKYCGDKIPLNISGNFPDAPDMTDNPDLKQGIDYIKSLFLRTKKDQSKDISAYATTAADPTNVRKIFDVAKMYILKRNLSSSGFVISD